jgi:glycosyltransferase involved in cell wall biosynthesis
VAKPKIWLEMTHTLARRGGRDGVGHYTEDLARTLAEDHPDQPYTIVGNVFATAQPRYLEPRSKNVTFQLSRWFPGKVWNQLFKRRLMPPINWLIPGRPDVVVFFNFVRYPLSPGIKSLVTIHDLTFVHYPERVEAKNLRYLREFVPRAVAESTGLIAISEFTKQDMVEHLGADPAKISVVPPGVDLERYRVGIDSQPVRDKLKLPDKYLLFVSTLEPRKNVPTLLAAYRALSPELRREYALVLAGKVGWEADALLADIAKGDEHGHIIHANYVDDSDMPGLYAGATAFVLPSHFEGFGMPALEAMACGVPVVTSNVSSIPEVVEGAGELLDPMDVAGFAAAMTRICQDREHAQDLARRGRARAEQYSWHASAQKLQAAIDQALSV